jgi:hypothetical protein
MIAIGLALNVMAGCYPVGPEFVSTLKTFYMADTVMVLTDPNTSPSTITVNVDQLLDRVRQNMINAGYRDVAAPLGELGETCIRVPSWI